MYYDRPINIFNQMKINTTDIDTSENSYFYNMVMPVAYETSYVLMLMDQVENKVFASKAYASGYSDYLDLRIEEFGLQRKPATYALPVVKFTGGVNTKIRAGFIVSTNDNRLYTTESDCVIGSDGTVEVKVKAEKEGSLYNVKAGDINYMPVKTVGLVSVTNPNDYNSAYDKETDEAFYNRYLEYVRKPHTSGNIWDYEKWCLEVEGVGSVKVLPVTDETLQKRNGHVTCVIINSNNEPASPELIQNVINYINPDEKLGNGTAPIGASLHVLTPSLVPINIEATISIDTLTTTLDKVKSTFITNVTSYFKTTVFKAQKLVYKKIEAILMDAGAYDISSLTINGSTTNINISDLQLASVGNINITLT